MMVVAVMPVVVMVMVRVTENTGADKVDGEADGRDQHRFVEADRLRIEKVVDGFPDHRCCHDEQEQCAREAGQDLDLPGAEGEAAVAREAARHGVGEGRKADRKGMRSHVPAVGQQRHRIEGEAGDDLADHHGERDPQYEAGTALGGRIAAVEYVWVPPGVYLMHVSILRQRFGEASLKYSRRGSLDNPSTTKTSAGTRHARYA